MLETSVLHCVQHNMFTYMITDQPLSTSTKVVKKKKRACVGKCSKYKELVKRPRGPKDNQVTAQATKKRHTKIMLRKKSLSPIG